jgi:hypothetical protein
MRIRRVRLLGAFLHALELQGPVRAGVVVGNPVFTDHRKVTLHKYVNFDPQMSPGISGVERERALPPHTRDRGGLRSANGLPPRRVPEPTDEP